MDPDQLASGPTLFSEMDINPAQQEAGYLNSQMDIKSNNINFEYFYDIKSNMCLFIDLYSESLGCD